MQAEVVGRKVGNTGFGLLGMGHPSFGAQGLTSKTPSSEESNYATLRAALAEGCNLWNGAEFYGTPERNSLTILRGYFEKYPEDADKVVLSVKGGMRPNFTIDGSATAIRESVENCLKMLGGRGRIDTFASSRRDPKVPWAETIGALAELQREGKIGGVALSEVSANTIREASEIVKVAAVEIELSLWSTEPLTNGILQVCAEKGIPVMAYSPVGRGFLTGQFQSLADLPEGDRRRIMPRFAPENFESNLRLVRAVEKLAAQKGCTPAQLALGWVRTLSKRKGMPVIIPIPGTTKIDRVKENAVEVELSEAEMREIDDVLAGFEVVGDRYPAQWMALANG